MLTIVVLVFVSVFTVLALVMLASGAGASQRAKQTLARLESALATTSSAARDQIVDVRKNELLSAVPMLNRWLLKMEVAPRLRILLYQANLQWTAGGLILMSGTCFVIFGYLVYLRTGAILFGLAIGIMVGSAPIYWVLRKRRERFDAFEQGLPEALDLMVSGLRAGHSLVAALRLVAHESPDPIG